MLYSSKYPNMRIMLDEQTYKKAADLLTAAIFWVFCENQKESVLEADSF